MSVELSVFKDLKLSLARVSEGAICIDFIDDLLGSNKTNARFAFLNLHLYQIFQFCNPSDASAIAIS